MKPTVLNLIIYGISVILACSATVHAGEISLAEATSRAIEKHPSLATFDAEKRAAEARILSALARPNPELEVEIEDILGSGEYRDLQSAVYNVGITQLLELGGKRKMRGAIARAEVEIQDLAFESAHREVILDTARRFVAVLAAQAVEENARQVVEIAEETVNSIAGLQEGGRGSEIDVKRSRLELKQARLQLENRKRESTLARQQLAAAWGDSKADFSRVAGTLTKPNAIQDIESLRNGLDGHPLVSLAEAGVDSAESTLALERKKSAPDLGVGVAWRRDSVIDDNAVVLNFSLPLPLWNRNEGGIAEAEAELDRQTVLVTQAMTRLDLALTEAWTRLASSHAEYELVAGEMLSAAEELYASLNESFRLGRASYLELLDARRSLTEVRREKIDALQSYHTARVEIEALTSNSGND